jgi:hypothetical protein
VTCATLKLERKMNHKAIKVLLIEDNPVDARLIKDMMTETGGMHVLADCVTFR